MTSAPQTPRRGVSRETRLLVVTITIAGVVLLLLSRMRFPEQPPIVAAPPAPLERLAARATYDELAGIVAGVERRIAPSLVVLRLAPETDGAPRTLTDALGPESPGEGVRHVPALRITPSTAIAAIGPGLRLVGIVGASADAADAASAAEVDIAAADPVRRLALVHVPPSGADALRHVTLSDLRTPTYVVVVEGTRAGLTSRPVFVGSSDRFDDPRWPSPLLAVSSVALTSQGALVFSLEGQFLGCAVVENGTLAIAAARDIVAAAEQLAQGTPGRPPDIGVSVQPLTPGLAAALGAAGGAVVAEVDDTGPAAGVLEPTDVVTAVDGRAVQSPDEVLLRIAQRAAGDRVSLSIVRAREPREVAIALPGAAALPPVAAAGMRLQARRGAGSAVVSVLAGSAAEGAGLAAGDLIVGAGPLRTPTPAQIESLLKSSDSGDHLVLTIERGGRDRVVALARPPRPDVAR